MRILFLGNYKSPEYLNWDGPQGAELGGLRKMPLLFRAFLAAGHEVRVVSSALSVRHRRDWQPQMKTTVEFPEGRVEVLHAPTTGIKPWGGLLMCYTMRHAVLRVAQEWKPQVAFAYNGLLAEAVALLALRSRFAIPFVVEVDDYPGVRSRGWNPKAKLDVLGWHFLQPKTTGLVLVNARLRDKFPIGNRPVFVQPGIVDDALMTVMKTRKAPFTGKSRILMYSGGLSVGRGADKLLAAFSHMPSDWRLVVSGAGPLLSDFQRLAAENPSRCVCLGFVTVERMFAALAEADAVVNPPELADNTEGLFPFKLLEYIISGAHIISTKLPPVEGPDLSWFQRWNGNPPELGGILQRAEADYRAETDRREAVMRWTRDNFSLSGVSVKLDQLLKDTLAHGQAR